MCICISVLKQRTENFSLSKIATTERTPLKKTRARLKTKETQNETRPKSPRKRGQQYVLWPNQASIPKTIDIDNWAVKKKQKIEASARAFSDATEKKKVYSKTKRKRIEIA